MCMYVCVWRIMSTYMGKSGDYFTNYPQEHNFLSLRQGLTLAWNSPIILYWLPREPLGSHSVFLSITSSSWVFITMDPIFT